MKREEVKTALTGYVLMREGGNQEYRGFGCKRERVLEMGGGSGHTTV